MNYIIPLRRGNFETKSKIPTSISEYNDAFIYHNRNKHCLTIPPEDYNIHLYLDECRIKRCNKKN